MTYTYALSNNYWQLSEQGDPRLKISAGRENITDYKSDTVLVNLFEGANPSGATNAIDKLLQREISNLIKLGDFNGKLNDTAILYPGKELAADRIIVVGLGKKKDFTAERAIQAAASGIKRAERLGAKHVGTIAFGGGDGELSPAEAAESTVIGALLSQYRFTQFKTMGEVVKAPSPLLSLKICEIDNKRIKQIRLGVKDGLAIAEAVALARNLQNTPAANMTPTILSQKARSISRRHGLSCQVLSESQMSKLGMGSLLGVSQGSAQAPKLIVTQYEPSGRSRGTIAIVGKGVTFDTGGISLKPGSNMHHMKFDMSGAAATLGIMQAVAQLKPSVKVIGVVPAVENMPSSTAVKPGDVLTAMNGKTIEVINTDAEGRLILADALCYAQNFKPDAMIDMATLTGSVITALGHSASGLMSTNDDLTRRLRQAGEYTRERVWELPLWEDYEKNIQSDTADLDNTGGKAAGTINGGMFLKHFVGDVPWVHLDIAGTAWEGRKTPYWSGGGTGVGVRLITQLLRDWSGPLKTNLAE
tara:strand:- start:7952 stop:9544 length:1593 start_codon:yes stop_codon:yes gene_type:complete